MVATLELDGEIGNPGEVDFGVVLKSTGIFYQLGSQRRVDGDIVDLGGALGGGGESESKKTQGKLHFEICKSKQGTEISLVRTRIVFPGGFLELEDEACYAINN